VTQVRRRLDEAFFCLCCLASSAGAHSPTGAPAPAIVRSERDLLAALESIEPTPLDALTGYGKREFIREMRWRDDALVGFGTVPLIRELDRAGLAAVLHWLDSSVYLPALERQLVGPPLRLPAPAALVGEAIAALRQFADEEDRRRSAQTAPVTETAAPAVLRRYRDLFGARMDASALTAQPVGDLVVLFDAAALAVERNPGSSALDDLVRVHGEFRSRGVDTARTLDASVMHALLAARQFGQARVFAAGRPNLADMPVPLIEDRLGPTFQERSVFAYDATRNTLVRQALPVPTGVELVMVVGAGCHNSDNALTALHRDAALQARLLGLNLVIVTPPAAGFDTKLLTEWNAANPALPIRVPYRAQEWRDLARTGVPAFYLLRNGQLVGERIGWPANGKALLGELIEQAAR